MYKISYFGKIFPGACDFEKGTCTYTNTKTGDDFDWLRAQGGTSSRFTGPTVDHTLGTRSGHYMYIETSAPRVNGDKARFLSQTFPPTNNSACMSFYYHMYGAEIGKLSVILLTNTSADSATTEAMLWQVTGDNGNSWNQGQVNIPQQYTAIPYQIVFEGVRGTGYRGDIGLDDISFDFTTGCQTVPSYAGSSQTGES